MATDDKISLTRMLDAKIILDDAFVSAVEQIFSSIPNECSKSDISRTVRILTKQTFADDVKVFQVLLTIHDCVIQDVQWISSAIKVYELILEFFDPDNDRIGSSMNPEDIHGIMGHTLFLKIEQEIYYDIWEAGLFNWIETLLATYNGILHTTNWLHVIEKMTEARPLFNGNNFEFLINFIQSTGPWIDSSAEHSIDFDIVCKKLRNRVESSSHLNRMAYEGVMRVRERKWKEEA